MGKAKRFLGNQLPRNDRLNKALGRQSNTLRSQNITPTNQLPGIPNNDFLKSSGSLHSGADGFISQDLTIDTGILDLQANAVGDIVKVRKYININPESGTTDTLDLVASGGTEFPQQELVLVGQSGDVLTITHDSGSAAGNNRAILCPGAVAYTLNGTDAVALFYDFTLSKWRIEGDATSGGGGGASFPLAYTINDQGSKGSGDSPLDHDTSAVTGHKLKFTITGDLTLTFSGLPASGTAMDWYVEVTQDGTGGHTVTWPAAVTPAITLSETADTTSLVALHTDDNGTIIRAVTLLNAVGTIGDNLGNHIATTDLEMSSHTINFNNDTIALSAANAAADGFLELKVDSADFFDFTESNNGVVGIKLRSQHATNPDNTLTLTQFSGTTGQAELFSPNRFHFFGSGSSEVFNFDQNRIETLVNILPDADGTINLGNSTNLRYAGVHAATFKFDTNRKLDFNTGGGSITVNGSLDSFILTVDSIQKLSSTATLTTLSGNVDITGIAGVGDKAEFTEITAPGADPSANTGWLYGKLVSGHTEPFWEDEDGTVTNLIGGGGGSVNQISQGDSSVTVSDTGTGSIVGKVDNVQKFNISPTSFNIDDSVVLGLLGSDTVTFNADVASDILPSSDNAHDLGASGAEWKDLYIDGIADIDRLENNGASVAVGDDLKFDFGDTVNFNASQSSTGSAGLADALPSKPTGYVIIKITDTEYVVPYYAKS